MRILMVGGHLHGETGDVNMIKNLSKALSHDNKVYLLPFLPLFNQNAQIFNFNILNKKLSLNTLFFCLKSSINWFKFIFKYLEKRNLRGIVYYFITLFYYGTIKAKVKNIKPNLIHVHGISIEAMPFIKFAVENQIPLVITIHLYSPNTNYQKKSYYNKEIENFIIKYSIKNNITLNVVSNSVKKNILENLDIPKNKINVVYNGVDLEKFKFVNKVSILKLNQGIPTDKTIIIQVGTLNKRKNHIAVLKAFKKMDDVIKNKFLYLIVGDGPEKNNLMSFCKQNKLDSNVIFKGKVSNDKINILYSLSDFFILPSLAEGLPLVFLEAMASGLPIITFSDLEGVNDIYNSSYMELITQRSTDAVIFSIINAAKKSWNKEEISDFAKRWDWKKVSCDYMELYKKSIKS